jgi:nitroreductase
MFIDNARLSPSARNQQALKYIISNEAEKNAIIFPSLAWAGYLPEWDGPEEGDRPSAYIIMLGDTTLSNNYFWDHGIAVQSILLSAVEKGYGGCIIASVKKEKLKRDLNIPDEFEVIQVIALGKPKESVVLEEMPETGDIKYWRDEHHVHHVPKRSLSSIILENL